MTHATQTKTLAPNAIGKTGAVPVLAVEAGGEVYGFPLSAVREILVAPPVADVPRAPAHVVGVISVRGQIITLLDLPKMLRLQSVEAGEKVRVLLLDNGQELVGVAVDRVLQVYRMEPSQLEYASSMGAELSDYIIGIGRISEGASGRHDMLILIDPVSLLGATL